MAHEIQRMQSRHHLMVDYHLTGMSNREIAEALEVTPENVGAVMNSPIVQGEIARRRNNQTQLQTQKQVNTVVRAREMVEENAARAVQKHIDLMDSAKAESLQLKAAENLLRFVYGEEKKGGPQTVVVIHANDVNFLKQVLAEDTDLVEIEGESDLVPDSHSPPSEETLAPTGV